MADLEIGGMDEIIKRVQSMGKAGEKIENIALKKAGNIILEEAKKNVPKRTENLKKGLKVSNIHRKAGNKYVVVGIQRGDNSKIFYGKFLEFGTSKMKAKPFLGPAYELKKEEVKETIKQEFKNALKI